MMKRLFIIFLFAYSLRAQAILTPGWHKLTGTAVCGGPENASTAEPNNFPQNINPAFAVYSSNGGFQSKCVDGFEDSSGGTVDTLRHRLIIWSGGHSGYWGNDVWSVELTNIGTANPVLVHLDYPADPGNIIGSTATIETLGPPASGLPPTTNSPGSRHTYWGITYFPPTDEMITINGATSPNGNTSQGSWSLAMGSVLQSCAPTCNPVWTNLGTSVTPAATGSISAYDPNTQGIWALSQGSGLWFMNSSHVWTLKANVPGIGYHSSSVIDPVHKYFIALGPQSTTPQEGIVYWNIDGSTVTQTQKTAVGPCTGITAPTYGFGYQGAIWDPIDRRVVVYPNNGNILIILDPATWTCTTETYGSVQGTDYPQATPFVNGDYGTFGHLGYDSALDIFIMCNDASNDCWYLHRRRGNEKLTH